MTLESGDKPDKAELERLAGEALAAIDDARGAQAALNRYNEEHPPPGQ